MSTFTPATLEEAVARFRDRHDTGTLVAALVAGSGITLTAPGWEKAAEVPYPEIFPFEIRALAGHTPTVTVWRRGGQGILAFNGRFHLYQGYSAFEVAAIPRLAGLLGAPAYLATNAAGSIDPTIPPGDLVAIRDHINLQATNALLGEWGRWRLPVFPDMTHAYDPGCAPSPASTPGGPGSLSTPGCTAVCSAPATRRRPRSACCAPSAAPWSACPRCRR